MSAPPSTAEQPSRAAASARAARVEPTGLRTVLPYLSPRRISGVYLFILVVIFFTFATSTFFDVTTARTISSQQAVTAIVAIGLTVALAAGVFDLSISGVMGLSNIIVAKLMVDAGFPPALAIIATVVIASMIGVVNGLLVVRARIDPFIATLGTQSILTAAIFVVSDNENVLGVPASFQKLSGNQVLGVPLPVFYVIALALVVWYVLAWTPIGRRLYATGGGREVARLAGVPVERYIMAAFMTSAAVAGLAGCLVVATIGTGSTDVGPSYLLPAFAAGFLGATQFRPGRFNVWGTVLAVYLLATGVQGLVLMGADVWVPDLFNGLALIVAVGLSGFQRRAKLKGATESATPERTADSSAAAKTDHLKESS